MDSSLVTRSGAGQLGHAAAPADRSRTRHRQGFRATFQRQGRRRGAWRPTIVVVGKGFTAAVVIVRVLCPARADRGTCFADEGATRGGGDFNGERRGRFFLIG